VQRSFHGLLGGREWRLTAAQLERLSADADLKARLGREATLGLGRIAGKVGVGGWDTREGAGANGDLRATANMADADLCDCFAEDAVVPQSVFRIACKIEINFYFVSMVERIVANFSRLRPQHVPAVRLVDPRQSGKTTPAKSFGRFPWSELHP
jgi:hypothetical protein